MTTTITMIALSGAGGGGRWQCPVAGVRCGGRPLPVTGVRCGRCPGVRCLVVAVAGVRWPVAGGRRPAAGGRWPVAGVRWPVAGGRRAGWKAAEKSIVQAEVEMQTYAGDLTANLSAIPNK